MPLLRLLDTSQQKKFDSCPKLTKKQRDKYFSFNDELIQFIDKMISPINQVGFLIQLGYFRASGKFFANTCFKINDVKFCCQALEIELDNDNYQKQNKSKL